MPGILYFHGRGSGPTGTKANWLAQNYGAVCPQLDTTGGVVDDLPAARAALAEHRPDLVTIVGGDHQLHAILETGELAEALASFGFHPRGD